ncbi:MULTISPECIES: bi-domain-containing oxidoreductase [Idiomarina]|jgi:predicted dehydrogenase/threonine dehydrogenase-like Zn-dependent dehydrogenase|nr:MULTISPECIES: bi-domain-containing oxidoreductase [Idiomarina]MAC34674.1 dehydrogenase [Haliea sp.]MAO68552.1 dehydrogenase [Idiomarina sp.]MBF81299.1 dehydrogenase [Idiomarina sp.]|tara:strand:+ start:13831 stop:15963 length:2133 start_codon:yes stop_codon:yes gene_type:complete
MKQILQDLSKGNTDIVESPSPRVKSGSVLIGTKATLISSGTERSLLSFGKASVLDKARQQPEKVRTVLEKVKTDGLLPTIDAVKSKLSLPLPLGYCNVGVVDDVGHGCENFRPGDRVVSNGPHADIVRVPKNLCAKIPNEVSNEEAAFTVAASIGLQGIRLVNPSLGEAVVVTGVGLIGLLTLQLLKAHGCRVLAIDYDESKLKLARQFGAETCNPGNGEDAIEAGMTFSRGKGVDAVIITASTQSSDPVSQAARMSRKRGRIVLVGVTGLELNRADFYEKELTFQVSCSYGPGRYDPNYEEKGQDYPIGFVRWTEQRNFEAILDMMASGRLDVKPLITHRYAFTDAEEAYETLSNDKSALGILLEYDHSTEDRHKSTVSLTEDFQHNPSEPSVGFIGAGNYASRMLIPAFKAANAQLYSIATSSGVNGVIHGKKAGFKETTTDTDGLIASGAVNTIAIVTRHNSHARFVSKALEAGKHTFVEKPLALNMNELSQVEATYNGIEKPPLLMVGFNRRFSPQVQKMKSLLEPIKQPKTLILTMNAGAIPVDHWTQDIEVGGGRIIGEACHFIDLARFLVGSEIVSVQTRRVGDVGSGDIVDDKASITLGFADGSLATIHYFSNGANSFPKERVEVFTAGRVLQLDNFRKLKGYGWPGFRKMNLWRQDKGQNACAKAFLDAIRNGDPSPIPSNELFEVARVTIEAAEQLRAQR